MMILKTKDKGGDGFQNRLLFLLEEALGDKYIRLKKIKEGKWAVQTGKEKWFLKLYPTSQKFRVQKRVTETLRQEGLLNIPGYHPIHENSEDMEIEGKVAGLTEWIDTDEMFTYHSFSERQSALSILGEFHHSSQKILMEREIILSLPEQKLVEKWTLRLEEFIRNKGKLSIYIPPAMIDTYIRIGQKALQGVVLYGFSEERCLLHGDLAHHNFLRDVHNELHIIDLDLIAKGPSEIDYIQFANRILPFFNWSLAKLWEHEPLSAFKENQPFLYGILFPSDVFREWNRFFREGPVYQNNVWQYLMEMTVKQFHPRMVYCRDIQEQIQKQERRPAF
jgi:hypothetical protein